MTRYDVLNTELAGVCVVEHLTTGPLVHLSNIEKAAPGFYESATRHPAARGKNLEVYLIAADYVANAVPGDNWLDIRPCCTSAGCMEDAGEGARVCERHARESLKVA